MEKTGDLQHPGILHSMFAESGQTQRPWDGMTWPEIVFGYVDAFEAWKTDPSVSPPPDDPSIDLIPPLEQFILGHDEFRQPWQQAIILETLGIHSDAQLAIMTRVLNETGYTAVMDMRDVMQGLG